jgi:hypothetical protein
MYAHYFKSRSGHQVIITDSSRPVGGQTISVSSKREARTIAKQHGAKPWNF